jgi:hypothetical protein
VRNKVNKNKVVGLIENKNNSKVICFFIYRFHEIIILIIIEIVFAKKNEAVPI